MRFIFKHVRDRNVQPASIFILFLIRRRYQDKERVGQSLIFREDNFKSRGVFKWNEMMFTFPWKKSCSAQVNSNYHPTAFAVLGRFSHLSIGAWKHNYFSWKQKSSGEISMLQQVLSSLLQVWPYSLCVSPVKKITLSNWREKKSYLLTNPEEPWGALNRETMVFIYSLKRQPTLYCSLQNWTRPYKKPQIVSDLKKQFLQLAW